MTNVLLIRSFRSLCVLDGRRGVMVAYLCVTFAGRIPVELGNLTALTQLRLNDNKLTGALLLRVCDEHGVVDLSVCCRCFASTYLLLCTSAAFF